MGPFDHRHADSPEEDGEAMRGKEREEIESVVWQILRKIYVRVETKDKGGGLNDAQQNALLDPWHKAMEHDLSLLMVCVDRGSVAGRALIAARVRRSEAIREDQLEDILGLDD